MLKIRKLKHIFAIGDNVTYQHKDQKVKEIGIVKEIYDFNNVFVVYNCNDEWDDYENYNAQKTHVRNLKKGW